MAHPPLLLYLSATKVINRLSKNVVMKSKGDFLGGTEVCEGAGDCFY